MYYRQCLLSKGEVLTTSWIPERYAKLNKILRIKKNKVWSNGWKVEYMGSIKLELEEIPRDDYRYHRRKTDV